MMLNPSAVPRCDTGNASVRMAVELAMSIAPPTPWTSRRAMSTSAPLGPVTGENANPIDATVNTRKPGVVHLDPSELVADPAESHDQHGGHDQVAEKQPEQVSEVCRVPTVGGGSRGRSTGREMITIDWFKSAMNVPSVVFDSAFHL